MYGSLEGQDLSFLIGAQLIQVCIGENDVVLNMHPDVSMMIASNVSVTAKQGETSTLESSLDIGTAMAKLLGSSVVEVTGESDGTLVLGWSLGSVTRILDTWADYESYTIRHGETVIVV